MNRKRFLSHARLALACAAVFAALATCQIATGQAGTGHIRGPVKISGGSVQGVPGKNASIMVFKGIPYAAPPVGDLRWRAPQPVVPWDGVHKADRFGSSCAQKEVYQRKPWTSEFMSHNDISEDCLYLNVWTPARSRAEKLPVYVYIHGGSNIEGSGAVPIYDGEGLARKGVIFVTPNYRLGIFGSFVHPELTAEAPYHASGNYSELDLIAALKWVKENIAKFGGDPDKVTLGAQAGGSGHIFSMTISPLAKGLFRGAIHESDVSPAVATTGAGVPLAEGEKTGLAFMAAKDAKSLADLRHLSWQELMDPIPASSPNTPAPAFRFSDVIDGYVFPLSPRETYAQGKQNDVPMIIGNNRNDLAGPAPHPDTTLAAYRQLAQARFGDMTGEFFTLYPASSDEEAKVAFSESTWDMTRTGPDVWSVWRAKTAKTKVFTYFWNHTLPGPDADKYGAFRTSEVLYAMNSLSMSDRPFTDTDRKIADTMSSYWANFIKTGDPNGPGLAHWASTSEQPGMTMELGDKDAPIPVAGDSAKREFLEKYFNKPQQQSLVR